jgi:O-antigen/teichoic acid export membrane protein
VGEHSKRSRKLVGTVLTRAGVIGCGAIAGIVTARVLHPAGRGAYAVIVAIATVTVSLGHLSVEQSNVYLWHRGADKRALAANTIFLGLLNGVVAALVAWFVVTGLVADALPDLDRRLVAIALLAVAPNMMTLYMSGLVVLDDRIARVNKIRSLVALFQVAAVVTLATVGRLTLMSVVVVWAVTASLPAFALVSGFGARPRLLSRSLAVRAMRTGAGYHLGMAALFLLWRVDLFLLNAQVGAREVGLYAVAVSVAELTYVVTDSVAQVVLPRQVVGSMEQAGAFTARVLRLNLVAGLGVVALIALASPVLIPVVFGASFSGSVAPLIGLLPGVAALGLIRPATAVLVRLDRPLAVSSLTGLALALNVTLNLALIPPLGAVGAGLASTVAYCMLALAYLAWFLRATGLGVQELRPQLSEIRELAGGLLRRRVSPPPAQSSPTPASGPAKALQ